MDADDESALLPHGECTLLALFANGTISFGGRRQYRERILVPSFFSVGIGYLKPGPLPWHLSLVGRWEVNTSQATTEIVVGDVAFVEFAAGLSPVTGLDVGLCSYALFQATGERNPALPDDPLYLGVALGGEVRYRLPWIPLSGLFRAHHELFTKNGVQPSTFFLGLVWAAPAKSKVGTPR